MTIESRIGIVTPEQADHTKAFLKGLSYLQQLRAGTIKDDWVTTKVVEGFMWGVASELMVDGKYGIIKDIMRQSKQP